MSTTEEQQQQQQQQAKKKERAPQPPPPPAICTAYVLVRYALTTLLCGGTTTSSSSSTSSLSLECGNFQLTYKKDTPRLTGRLGLTVGKDADTPLVDDKATTLTIHESSLWTTLERTLTRLVTSEALSLAYVSTTKRALMDKYGEATTALLLEEAHVMKKSKTKPEDPLGLVILYDDTANGAAVPVFACFSHGPPYANGTTTLQSIALELSNCDVKAGKKGVTISAKFEVFPSDDNDDDESSSSSMAPTLHALPDTIPAVLLSLEGHALVEETKRIAAETAAAPAAAAAAEEQAEGAAAAAQETEAAATTQSKEMKVNPFEVEGTIDYDKLVSQFGSTLIDDDLMQRLKALTVGKGRVPAMHRFLRRGIFFSHRDLHAVVTSLEQSEAPMYLYTGRGPSSAAMHLGHLVPFLFTQWLQQAFDCPLVIQMTDDEKFIFKGDYEDGEGDNLEYFQRLTMENAKDIIACGFDYQKTFLFSDFDYVGTMYPNICRIWRSVTTNTVNGMFGFDGSSNMGKIAFPAVQAAPSFASSFPVVLGVPPEQRRTNKQVCLIPCAIDQDPYFRMTRDVAHKLVDKTIHPLGGKPALIHSKFFPPLQGAEGKMSSSNTNSAIFLTDTADEIAHKIRSFCFSGGRETKAAQQEFGANLEIDVAYQWLRFFLEDDEELELIGRDYSTGSGEYWSTNKVKERLIGLLQHLVAQHQERRAKITDEEVRKWMKERSILSSSS